MKKIHPPHLADICPCQSGILYAQCCQPWHGEAHYLQAPNAQALMRSRYSAFVLDLRTYLLSTWHPNTRPASIDPPEESLKWLGLQIKQTQHIDPLHATVEFVARYRVDGRAHRIHETSLFEKIDQHWFYVDGEMHSAHPTHPPTLT